MLPYRGFWSLLCGPLYVHIYSKWRVVLLVVLCCMSLLVRGTLNIYMHRRDCIKRDLQHNTTGRTRA
jgi:hypothetical protein